MRRQLLLAAGVLLAALIPAIVLAALTPITPEFTAWQFALVVVFYPYVLLAVLIFGLPLYFALAAVKQIRWWTAAVSGIVAGSIAGALFSLPASPNAESLALDGLLGLTSALVFMMFHRLASR